MKKLNKYIGVCLLAIALSSCHKDLDLKPTNDVTADVAYKDFKGYTSSFARLYGSLTLTSTSGPNNSDLGGLDAGTSDFLRLFWNAQELTTDEAACAWLNDPGISGLDYLNFDDSNPMLRGLYTRCIYSATLVNEFLRESTDAKLAERGISDADKKEIAYYRAEARFLRAYNYWVLLDLFGNPPFVTEETSVGKVSPPQIKRAELFAYVEKELLEVAGMLKGAKQNVYGRVDQVAAWGLLARLYLNAEVYLGAGNKKYTEAITFAEKVLNSGYSLGTNYRELFYADNDVNNPEFIFYLPYDGTKTQSKGGTTYLINAAIDATMDPTSFGVPGGGWAGNRTRDNIATIFGDYSGATDKRAMFHLNTSVKIEDIAVYKQGLAVTKFRNVNKDGKTAPPAAEGFVASVDFPLIRLAEMNLVYAEATLRGGSGGSLAKALDYVNKLRVRAYGNNSGNLTNLSLDDILNERVKELYWEGFRRSDLIRYGKFTGDNYLWPFKGGVLAGQAVAGYRALFPLPASDIIANSNLVQNPGYN
ncbi:RagB/SusD family nutrient uptake outer membrane protein [Sphingobacterium siyangense]|uniref:RagB/SusD family nutrient uptake outer membrane protein n=1 Tax=Sphingobacterium siyangense TaxID=459529 RepID=UPI00301AA76D